MSLRRALAVLGWAVVAATAAGIAWVAAIAPDNHIRGLVIGLGGALSLAIPPTRQAFRNHQFRHIDVESHQVLPAQIVDAILRRQNAAFVEFSWFDVACFALGPILLSAGIILDVSHAWGHH